MKKVFALFLLGIFCSIASYAIDPIVGSTTTCVGWTATLSDATPGGTWSSSNPSVATVSSSGLVSGIGAGTCTITYAIGSSYVTTPFTVNPANVITGPTSVCTGNNISLTGWPSGGSWTSGTPTVATVSSSGHVTGVGTGIVNIYYTGGGCYAYQIVNVSPSIPPLTGITTVGTSFTTTLSSTVSGGVWTSSNTAIATVGSGSGVVTGITAGSCNITYSVGGCYATALVTVTTSISPISGSTSTCAGSMATVTATPSGGTWSTSNTAIATINSMGVVNGIAAGTVTITYTVGSVFVTRSFTVYASPSISGSSTVCTGLTTMLTAAPSGGTWSSSNTMIATVASTGIITGISAGTATITYTSGTCSAYKTITVSPTASITGSSTACIGYPTMLTGSPTGGSWTSSSTMVATVGSTGIVTGTSSGTATITYHAFGCVGYKTMTVNASPVVSGGTSVCVGATVPLSGSPSGGTWSSSNIMIATVGSTGVVTGTGSGLVTISYTRGGCSAPYTLSVNPVPVITGPGSLCVGMNTTLAVTPTGGSWTSGSPSVATVSPAGLVTAVSSGVVNIYYTASGCYNFKPVTVNTAPAPIMGTTTVAPGGTSTLTCATPGGTWSSSNPMIATVGSSSGFVTGIASGTCNITYNVGGCYVYVPFTVGTTSISPIIGPSSTCVGSMVSLASSTCCGTWSSSHPGIATVSPLGVVTGTSAGTCIITYTVGTLFVTHTFTVYSSAAISGPPSVCTGIPHTLTASVSGGTWSTADTALVTISSSGVLTGLSAGTATITYFAGGCYAYYTVTVNAAPTITGGSSLCVGYTAMLSATPAGGSWTSGTPTVATVSSSGLVTGVSNGVVNIYYTQGSCYSFKTINVGTGAAITGGGAICIGTTTTLSATPAGGTWSSGSIGIAIVGSTGIVTGITAGVANISYTMGGCASYIAVTVNGSPVITGDMPICTGSSITLTGSVSGGTWSGSNIAVATVSPTGSVTGIAAGVVNITYTTGSCYAYKTITVSTSATISGPSLVCIGTPSAFTGTPAGGMWSSSNTFRAIVNSMGVVTGLGGGVVNISYTAGSCSAYITVTVSGAPIITGGGGPICSGDILSLSASSGGVWSSSNTAVATVSSSGSVTGVGAGIANITYTAGGCFTYATVTVHATPVISGGSVVCIGVPLTLTGSPTGGSWSSSNTFRAIVNPSGIVTGLGGGAVNISYTLGSCYAYKTLTVTGAPTILGSSTLCSGSVIMLTGSSAGGTWATSNPSVATVTSSGTVVGISGGTATITYNLGGCFAVKPVTVNPTPTITGGSAVCTGTPLSLVGSPSSGVWASSNPSLASVNAFGQVTGISAGTVTITYTLNGCSAYHTVTISAGATILGSGPVCVGSTITFTSSLGGGTWSSSSTAIATVSGGNVTGVGAGVAIISYTMGSGCSAIKPVTVNPNPAPIMGPGSVRIGSSITLINASPGGTWFSTSSGVASVGPTTGIVMGLTLGTTNIQYWWGGCATVKPITVTLFPPVGAPVTATSSTASASSTSGETRHLKPVDSNGFSIVATEGKIGSVRIFPNPTSGDIIIQWQDFDPGTFTMVIADVAGRKVHTSTISINAPSSRATVSLAELVDGIYFFTITDGHTNYYGKLYIQK